LYENKSLDGYLLTLLPFSIYFTRLKKYSFVCFISGRISPDSHLVGTSICTQGEPAVVADNASEEVEMDAVEKEKL